MSKALNWFFIAVAVISVPFLLFMVGASGFMSPMSLVVGLPAALAYVALVVFGLSRMPLWPRMSRRSTIWWVLACLMWGGGFALIPVMVVATSVMNSAEALGWKDAVNAFGGAYPEEPIKAFGVLLIVMMFAGLNRPWHGLVTGALVGLGFETTENLLYGSMLATIDPISDMRGALAGWGLRLVAGPFLHIIWTAIAGWGIGLALFTADRRIAWRLGAALGWLAVPFIAHFLWNYLGSDPVAIFTSVLASLIQYPVIIWLIARAWKPARDDATYVHTPRALTSFREIALIDDKPALPAT